MNEDLPIVEYGASQLDYRGKGAKLVVTWISESSRGDSLNQYATEDIGIPSFNNRATYQVEVSEFDGFMKGHNKLKMDNNHLRWLFSASRQSNCLRATQPNVMRTLK